MRLPKYTLHHRSNEESFLKFVDAPENRVSARKILDIISATGESSLLTDIVYDDAGISLRKMFSTIDDNSRVDFGATPSTETDYWVVGADSPHPVAASESQGRRKSTMCCGKSNSIDETENSGTRKFWNQKIVDLGEDQPDDVEVEAYLCPIYGFAAIYENPDEHNTTKTSVLHTLVRMEDPEIFDHELPGLLVQFKWDAYVSFFNTA